MEGAHWEIARGHPETCIAYCSKDETRVGGPYIFGHRNPGQGSRGDLYALRDAIKEGKTDLELFNDDGLMATAARHLKAVEKMRHLFSPPTPRDNIKVTLHYGPPGTGKTFCAHQDGAYYFDGNNGFWNGYNGETTIILDEFGGHCLTPLMFQRLCDRYPFECNIKGGSTHCNATDIHICSNYLPSNWWKEGTKFNAAAIYRRIHEVHYHDKIKHFEVFKTDEESTAIDKLTYRLRNVVIPYLV